MFHIIVIFNFIHTFYSRVLSFTVYAVRSYLHRPVIKTLSPIALCHFEQFVAANFGVVEGQTFVAQQKSATKSNLTSALAVTIYVQVQVLSKFST